jgi:hypothetical protein
VLDWTVLALYQIYCFISIQKALPLRGGLPATARIAGSGRDGVLHELEGRLGDLFVRVVVTVGEAREAAHAHDHELLADAEDNHGGLLGRLDAQAVARTHGLDGGRVAGVAAGHDALLHDLLGLVHRQDAAADRAVATEHATGQRKTEIGLHGRSSVFWHRPCDDDQGSCEPL